MGRTQAKCRPAFVVTGSERASFGRRRAGVVVSRPTSKPTRRPSGSSTFHSTVVWPAGVTTAGDIMGLLFYFWLASVLLGVSA